MNEYSVIRFFNQFIKTINQDIKNVGIITDKDGTLLLNDNLKAALKDFREKELGANIYVIANSGRTVQDMINCLEQQNIPLEYFDYIIGDNGGMCLDARTNKQMYKHVIDKEIVSKVIQKFIEIGGKLSDIRLADGKNILAYPADEVRQYYSDTKDVIFKEDITDLEKLDITKLTLTGSHEQINDINKFIRENIRGYKTHLGKTFFPQKERDNYRIDFTRNAYKR